MSTVASLSGSTRTNGQIDAELMTGLAALEAAVGELEANPQLSGAVVLADLRRSAADEVARLNRREPQPPSVAKALDLVRRFTAVGALDLPLADEDRDRLAKWEELGWPGLLASMLMTAAWRWSSAPVLSNVPDWLWGEYTDWLFATPNPLITSEDCAIYANHIARHTDELARWAQRNMGSPSVKTAVEAFARRSPLCPLRFTNVNTRAASQNSAKIMARLHGREIGPFDPVLMPRIGRALRIGFVARQWDLDTHTSAALARFEQLPADRVERILFSAAEPMTPFGWHCRDKAQEFHVLPADLAGQVSMLRDLNLDVVVFLSATSSGDEFSQLPLFRVAGLQVVQDDAHRTSGMPEVDVQFVPASISASIGVAGYTERLAVLPNGAETFALRRGGDAELAYSREDLGFAADAVVLVAVLASFHGAGEQLSALARMLALAPQTRLVLHVRPDGELPQLGAERFCAVVEAVMTQAGVALDRVSILAPAQATHEESRAIVRLADLYLGTPGTAIWAAEAISTGIPVIATHGVEAEWLKADRLAELVAADTDSYVNLAVSLASDTERRAALKQRFSETVTSGLSCADTLASSDAFLGLIETAFDQLEAHGRAKFRRYTETISAGGEAEFEAAMAAATSALDTGDVITAVDMAQRALGIRPLDATVRALYGRALLAEGRPDRASIYLLAAVEQLNDNADIWFALATSLRNEGKNSEATQALESSLRLDPKRADGWLMLIELAESAGAFDIAKEAYDALKECAPAHPQLVDLAFRFES